MDVALVEVGDREVRVRLADGRTGVMPRDDFDRAGLSDSAVGSEIRAAVLHREDRQGQVSMSAAWAAKSDAWHTVESAARDKTVLSGTVGRQVKGGLLVELGMRAFLPRSQVGELEGELADLVGTEVEVMVQEIDRAADRLVVSRRDAQRRRRRAGEKQAWSEIAVGQKRMGVVTSVEDYGAKVQLGPLRGLVHRSELSWSRVDHPGDVVSVGQEVEVEVLEVTRSKRRLGLSMRRTADHPLDGVEVGAVCSATVFRVVDYGAFARLDESGAEGLVHVSELSELPGQRADQLVIPGEQLRVKVLSVDRERNRMALSALAAALAD